ncbi:helix-turn-helix transcriptional regulator [Chamaesiphon sp. VAR_69_metabat_338]|uniref:helix-turn-helix transcriptional regulator n=1 Tax=Chamaesiphon sp. VAR_69_metabat_338 TaxID=2964704 RepID=UPI00286E345E|nr:helix-turn-helix transcriptional regulator [Chamaesiphon sp. VAR_69_metabat_338]
MESLSIEDIEQLNQSIQQLYALQYLDTFGVTVLSIVDRLVASDLPLFHLTNTRTGQICLTYLPNFPTLPSASIDVLTKVLAEDRQNHPIAQNMPQTLNGAYKLSDFITQSELHSRESLYQQFLRPLHIEDQTLLFLPDVTPVKWGELARSNTTLAGFILSRPSRSFTERDRLILNLLRPHLSQAYTNVQQYHQLQQDLNLVRQSLHQLGAIVLDGNVRITSIAPQAIIWLETYFEKATCWLQLPDRLRSWVKYQVTCLMQNPDLPAACLPLRIQQDGRELTIRLIIESPGARYLLLLEEQTISSLNSLALLGLSQRETEVLALVMQGKDNKAIAVQLSVHPSTIRKHLENIYSKWGVKSRTEAIAQALAKLGLF